MNLWKATIDEMRRKAINEKGNGKEMREMIEGIWEVQGNREQDGKAPEKLYKSCKKFWRRGIIESDITCLIVLEKA